MRKFFFNIIIYLFYSTYALSETKFELRAKYVLTNMHNDYINCYVFYKIGAESIRKSNDQNEIIKGVEASSDISLKFAFETGELLGIKIVTMKEQVKSEMKSQINEIDNDYSNVSILLKKYSSLCKKLIENKKQRIDYWEKKAVTQFK